MRLACSLVLVGAILCAALPLSFAQSSAGNVGGYPVGGQLPQAPTPRATFTPPPPPVHTPPPTVHTPPPRVVPTTPTTNQPFLAPQQIDLSNDRYNVGQDLQPIPLLVGHAADGLNIISHARFPIEKDLKGSSELILVRGEPDAVFTRPNRYTAKLEKGTIMVSVRRPSEIGLIQTPIGDVALHSDGDVMLTWAGSALRVYNISALRNDCKVKIFKEVLGDGRVHTVSLKTGYEMIASDHKLSRGELRPPDGIARRRSQLLANGHLGVCEFSVQSVLEHSAIIAQMQQAHSAKETRVLGQMSKMAAVLNVVNSPYGYTASSPTGLASASQTH
jgi:hypothetical protein